MLHTHRLKDERHLYFEFLFYAFIYQYMTVFNISNSHKAFMLTYLSQDLSINAKNETLNCTQGLRNGLIKKYWKEFPLHLWWFRSWQFSQTEMYSPLFSSMHKSKLGLATGKHYTRFERYSEISVKLLTKVGRDPAVCSSPICCWSEPTIVLPGSGIFNAFSLGPDIHSTSKSSLPTSYSGHQGIKFGLGETTGGTSSLSFNPGLSLHSSLCLYPTHSYLVQLFIANGSQPLFHAFRLPPGMETTAFYMCYYQSDHWINSIINLVILLAIEILAC